MGEETTVGLGPVRASTLTSIGRYVSLDKIGEGGQGVVFRAHDPTLARDVAIKTLSQTSASARARFLGEARALARVEHPSVVRIYEVDSLGDLAFLVMEYLEGESLRAWLRRSPSRAERERAVLALATGLAAIHAAGLVHRDIKPDNVICTHDGRFVLVDFGLALDALEATPSSSIVGTPAYMAPEQLTGDAVGPPADQFALCVTAWEVMTGVRPFVEDSSEQRAVAPRPRAGPRWISRILRRGLATDPADRWPSIAVLATRLRRAWRFRIAIPIALVAVIAIPAAIGLLRSSPEAATSKVLCDELADALAGARFSLAGEPTNRSLQMARTDLSVLHAQYVGDLANTCATQGDPLQHVRLTCLASGIDELIAGTSQLAAPPSNPLLLSTGVPSPAICAEPMPPQRRRLDPRWLAQMILVLDGKSPPGFARSEDACQDAYWYRDDKLERNSWEEQRYRAALRCGDDYRVAEDAGSIAIAMYELGKQDHAYYEARARATDAQRRYPIAYQAPAFTVFRARDAWDIRDYQRACTQALAALDELHAARSWGMVEIVVAAVGKFCATNPTDAARGIAALRPGLDDASELAGAARAFSPEIVWRRLGYLAWWAGDGDLLASCNARLQRMVAAEPRPHRLRVVDRGGHGVPRARVELVQDGGSIFNLEPSPIHDSRTAMTDPDGFAMLPAFTGFVYAHRGTMASAARINRGDAPLVLEDTVLVTGRVDGELGGVSPSVVMQQQRDHATDHAYGGVGPVTVSRVDPDGTFTLRTPPASRYRAYVRMVTRIGPIITRRPTADPLVVKTPEGRLRRVIVQSNTPEVAEFKLDIFEGRVRGATPAELWRDAERKHLGARYAETLPDPAGRTGHYDHAWDVELADTATLCFAPTPSSRRPDDDKLALHWNQPTTCITGPFSDPVILTYEP